MAAWQAATFRCSSSPGARYGSPAPDKVLFGERGETKLDLVRYYAAVAEPLMRTMGGRPVLMQRFPKGAGGPSFFQKRVPESAPEWLETTTVETVNGTPSRALVAADVAHVAWAVNLACLGFHVWPHRADDPEHADELRLDLDPQPGTGFAKVARRRAGAQGAAGRARARRLPEDDRQSRPARLRPAAAAVGLLRGALRRGRGGARARAAPPRHPHRGVVEGGARRADLRRLQPERSAQDRVRRLVGARPRRRPGLDADALGGARRLRPGRADARERARRGSSATAIRGPRSTTRRSRWSRCWRCTSATARTACSTRRGRRSTQSRRRATAGRTEPGAEPGVALDRAPPRRGLCQNRSAWAGARSGHPGDRRPPARGRPARSRRAARADPVPADPRSSRGRGVAAVRCGGDRRPAGLQPAVARLRGRRRSGRIGGRRIPPPPHGRLQERAPARGDRPRAEGAPGFRARIPDIARPRGAFGRRARGDRGGARDRRPRPRRRSRARELHQWVADAGGRAPRPGSPVSGHVLDSGEA